MRRSSPYQHPLYSPERASRKRASAYLLLPFIAVGVAALVLIIWPPQALLDDTEAVNTLLPLALTLALIAINVGVGVGNVPIAFSNPLSLYGIFFFLYYLVPFTLLLYSGDLRQPFARTIAWLIAGAYAGWVAGLKLGGVRATAVARLPKLAASEAKALYVLCVACIGAVAYVYVWRVQNGIFYNQARAYSQELSFAASFRDAFAMQLQLPVIVFLGIIAGQRHVKVARIARKTLFAYCGVLFIIAVFSSQTRLAITVIVFMLASVHAFAPLLARRRHLVLLGGAGFVALLFIQIIRTVAASEFSSSENQFTYALRNAVPTAVKALGGAAESGLQAQVSQRAVNRAGAGLTFLTSVMDALDERGSYLEGRGIRMSLPALVPRVLWPAKPEVTPPQLIIEDILGMPLYDAAVVPITELYVEGGPLAVVGGHLLFGMLIAWLTRRTMRNENLKGWIIVAVLWSHVVVIEQEQVVGSLIALRNALVLIALYVLAKATARALTKAHQSRRLSIGGQAAFRIYPPRATTGGPNGG